MPSETDFIKTLISEYCKGYGCDIGCGNAKVKDDAVGIDLMEGMANIISDCQELPFPDNHFDYVYSSHLIEDFMDTLSILEEWIRVLRDGGILILAVPDQGRYEWHFEGQIINANHKHSGMGYWFIKYQLLRFCINTGYWAEELYNYQPNGKAYSAVAVWRVFKDQREQE